MGTPGVGGHPVLAAARGTAKTCPLDDTAGYSVVIDHGNGHRTRYLHLNSLGLPVSGQVVARGQPIGYEGNTGYTDPDGFYHLHFETRHAASPFTCGKDGTAVNPYYSGTYMWLTNPPSMRPADLGGGGGCADVLARSTAGALKGFWGNCSGGFGTVAAPIISGWSGYTWLLEPGDFSGGGCPDVLARTSSGNLYGFWGDCSGTFGTWGQFVGG